MIGTAIAETLHSRLDRPQTETVVHMRLEGMPHDVRPIQLDTRTMRRQAELGLVGGVVEVVGDALHAVDDGTLW
jgi:hypothetical protein